MPIMGGYIAHLHTGLRARPIRPRGICLEERLVYRGDFALGTLMRFLPIVTQIFLWYAIFDAVKGTRGADDVADVMVGGYHYTEFVAYYLLTMISRAFSSMPGPASGIATQIG